MPLEEVWLRVAHECPRRILAALHRAGEYRHGTTPGRPGKVLCCHRDTPLPQGWTPTPAQREALAEVEPAHAIVAEAPAVVRSVAG